MRYFAESTDYRQSADFLEQKLGGVAMLDVAIQSGEASGVNEPAFIQAVAEFADFMASHA